MKFIGRDDVLRYDESHFVRQQPGGERLWQDSAWLHWWDLAGKVGGVHRIGHEYNIEGGPKVALWVNLVTPKGAYKRVVYQPLREADKLPKGWGGGDDTCRFEYIDGLHVWTIDDREAGISAELRFKDFHESFRGFPSGGRTFEDVTAHHLDVGGSVTGTINMKGSAFRVDGMGVRDHGWGHRDLGTMRSHRYVAGVFGPDLVLNAWAIHHAVSGGIEAFGWAVKGETVVFAKDVDIVAYTEIDSTSTRGGHAAFTLADGEVMEMELTAVAPGLMNYFHNMPNLNTLCRATLNGREGSGMLESSMNYHQGQRAPDKLQRGLVANGFYPAPLEPRAGSGDAFIRKRTL